jgi:hypothetical protein
LQDADVQIFKKKPSSKQRLNQQQALQRRQIIETMEKGIIKEYREKIAKMIRGANPGQKRNDNAEVTGNGIISELSLNQEESSINIQDETSRFSRNPNRGHMKLNSISQSSSSKSIKDSMKSYRKHTFGDESHN